MRIEVTIPDPVYAEAQRLAAVHGVSFDMVVAEAVQGYVQDDLSTIERNFTPDVLAALDRAGAEADAGQVMTFEQYERESRMKRDAWLRDRAS